MLAFVKYIIGGLLDVSYQVTNFFTRVKPMKLCFCITHYGLKVIGKYSVSKGLKKEQTEKSFTSDYTYNKIYEL